jgi:uncharacterized protein (DUF1800 family)
VEVETVGGVRADVALLWRRAGFGPSARELDHAAKAGYRATVEQLLDMSATDAADARPVPALTRPVPNAPMTIQERQAAQAQLNAEAVQLRLWWLNRLVTTSVPLREKLVLLWHGHFATALSKVRYPSLMFDQNQVFRQLGSGNFEALTNAVAKDPAMLLWLDSNTNVKSHPNENFARELMELFTLGIGNYSETDVQEAARAFSGWSYDVASLRFVVRPAQHDTGVKTLLGESGPFGGDDVIRLVTTSTASAHFVTAKLWSRLAYPVSTTAPVVKRLAKPYAQDLDVAKLVRSIFLDPAFRSKASRTGLVKQPIEYVAGTLRALGLRADEPRLITYLTSLGQTPFEPPSVGGWPQNTYWLSTATALARLDFATTVAARADVSMLTSARVRQRPGIVARALGVDGWSPTTHKALARVASEPRSLLALALTSPEYIRN